MLLIPFSLGIVTWVRVQYCIAVFASTEHFNKGGIWSKLKAGEALTLHAKLKELFITSNTYTVAPSMTSKTILQSATPCCSFMTVGIVQTILFGPHYHVTSTERCWNRDWPFSTNMTTTHAAKGLSVFSCSQMKTLFKVPVGPQIPCRPSVLIFKSCLFMSSQCSMLD